MLRTRMSLVLGPGYITSNQQIQMFVQNRNRIVSEPNVMPGARADDGLAQANRLSHRNESRQRGVI